MMVVVSLLWPPPPPHLGGRCESSKRSRARARARADSEYPFLEKQSVKIKATAGEIMAAATLEHIEMEVCVRVCGCVPLLWDENPKKQEKHTNSKQQPNTNSKQHRDSHSDGWRARWTPTISAGGRLSPGVCVCVVVVVAAAAAAAAAAAVTVPVSLDHASVRVIAPAQSNQTSKRKQPCHLCVHVCVCVCACVVLLFAGWEKRVTSRPLLLNRVGGVGVCVRRRAAPRLPSCTSCCLLLACPLLWCGATIVLVLDDQHLACGVDAVVAGTDFAPSALALQVSACLSAANRCCVRSGSKLTKHHPVSGARGTEAVTSAWPTKMRFPCVVAGFR